MSHRSVTKNCSPLIASTDHDARNCSYDYFGFRNIRNIQNGKIESSSRGFGRHVYDFIKVSYFKFS